MRPQNLNVLLQKPLYPKKDVSNKELEKNIADWEKDVEVHARATSHTGEQVMAASVQKMLLLQMCSPALRAHFRMRDHLLPDYGAIRHEIADWVFEELPHKKVDKALNAVTVPEEQETKEEEWEEAQVWSEEFGGWICGLAPKRPRTESPDQDEEMPPAKPAQTPSSGGKKGSKGGKKGKGKQKGLKGGCYSCGGPHYQADCPLG